MPAALRWLVVAIHFVCPLIFFTDLTRNPYVTQIVLLNIGLLAACAVAACSQASAGELKLPRTPLDLPLAAWALVCAGSWLWAYFAHVPFFRDSMRSEGARAMMFLAVNTLAPFYLAALFSRDCPDDPALPAGRWAVLAGVFGLMWTFFPQMRSGTGMLTGAWDHAWDPYGAVLWGAGLAAMIALAGEGSVHHIWHAALCTGFLAAVYGVAQYFSLELVWPKILNPYGGRSVSTFGNPNFMSSYMVLLLPLAAVYFLQARARLHRLIYAALFLALEAGLLCSLTRSSWAGAAAAFIPLAFSERLRRKARESPESTGSLACLAAAIALFWPHSNVQGYASSVVGRLTEVSQVFHSSDAAAYSPLYQRVLIWLCCWMMGAENPLLGKGWGHLELFYPFYQGHVLNNLDFFRGVRTHANNAHNEILETWAQTGMLGLGALAWLWTVFFKSAVRGNREEQGSVWILAAACGVLGMLVDNLLNVSLHFAVPGFLFWWQAGTVMGFIAHRQGWSRSLALGARARAAAAALAVLAASWGSWQWVRQWNREVYYFLGFKATRRESMSKAIELLTTAYRWHPREVNADYELGNAYARAEQFDKAAWAYREALKANAGYDEIYFNLGIVLASRLGDREGALKNFVTSWAINPLSRPLYENLGRFYMADPNRYRTQAIELLESANRFFPGDMNFLSNLAYLHSLAKDYAKAEGVYADILAARPDLATAESNLRVLLRQSGHKPPPVLARVEEFRRLEARIGAKDYGAKTLELARRAAENFPSFVPASFYLGNLELSNGDALKAEGILRSVLQADPQNIHVVLNLAEACRRLGRQTEYVEALRAALAIDPNNAYALAQLRALRP